MTTDLEKQFFSTFGIEEKKIPCYLCPYETVPMYGGRSCNKPFMHECETKYPEITDRILLELMELLMKQQTTEFYYHDDEYLFSSKLLGSNRPTCNRVNNLRELVLRTAICLGGFTTLKDEMLQQVQALFIRSNNYGIKS